MNTFAKLLLAAGLAAGSLAASAQDFRRDGPDFRHDRTQEIDQRQARQEQRIERGVATGAISRQEARELRREQREIARTEARALADGRLDRREMRELTTMLDAADERIRQSRHDRDRRHFNG
jgi:hypothetical protein